MIGYGNLGFKKTPTRIEHLYQPMETLITSKVANMQAYLEAKEKALEEERTFVETFSSQVTEVDEALRKIEGSPL